MIGVQKDTAVWNSIDALDNTEVKVFNSREFSTGFGIIKIHSVNM